MTSPPTMPADSIAQPASTEASPAAQPFHVMAKPIGPICNLDCTYCYYLDKERLYPDARQWRMSDEILENYIRQYIASQPAEVPEISFAWQGGEPTLLGVAFFEKVVAMQQRHAQGRRIRNAMQTNGTLLDEGWCRFLADHGFLVGISLDGPRALHDCYRVDKRGQPTFDDVMRGLNLMKRHGVAFNTLTVVNRRNARHPLKIYRFLRDIGSQFMQFIPLVERAATTVPLCVEGSPHGLAGPPESGRIGPAAVTDWSVEPGPYGEFLVRIFDRWVQHDVGRVFVQLFDVSLGNWAGAGSSLCLFAPTCGRAVVMEHNGDLFSCDHYVYPRYRLGNIADQTLGAMVDSPAQRQFGNDKTDALPAYCRRCKVRFACHGECPKHRFVRTPDGEPGLNYLCAAYKRFFTHIDPSMRTMVQLLRHGRDPAAIMTRPVNTPSPPGSEKKRDKNSRRG